MIVIARKANMGDCKEVFEWRNDSITRQMSFTSNVVLWEDHLRWYELSLASEKRLLLICEAKEKVKNIKLGIVRFDFVDDGRISEISINLSPSVRGKGYGKECLKKSIFYMADEWPMCKLITANVKKINETSKRVFEQVGFNVVAEDDLFWKFELPCLESQ